MKIKPQWTCTNEQGDKFFYYPALGWINSVNGEAGRFDLTVVQPQTPEGTTHIQVVNGKVQFVQLYATTLANIWTDGRWSECCSIDKLPGTVVQLSDGYVRSQPIIGPPEWVEHDGHLLTMPNNAEQVYYCFRSDPKTVRGPHAASQLLWDHKGYGGGDIIRWRYAR
jgi:hypothetical protein